MKKEEVIGKTIITITNNRDKDKTQPHDLQPTMTRLLVYLNDPLHPSCIKQSSFF